MTGRDLIIYILENKLENKNIFEDGNLFGFMAIDEAALKFEVGESTIKQWIALGWITSIKIGNITYIPINATKKVKENIKKII